VAVFAVVAAQFIGHLVVDAGVDVGGVLQGQPRPLPERHRPVGVETPVRVGGDHLGVDLGELAPAAAEEVAVGHLDRRLLGTVPVGAQHQLAPVVGVGGDPDIGDDGGRVDIGQGA